LARGSIGAQGKEIATDVKIQRKPTSGRRSSGGGGTSGRASTQSERNRNAIISELNSSGYEVVLPSITNRLDDAAQALYLIETPESELVDYRGIPDTKAIALKRDLMRSIRPINQQGSQPMNQQGMQTQSQEQQGEGISEEESTEIDNTIFNLQRKSQELEVLRKTKERAEGFGDDTTEIDQEIEAVSSQLEEQIKPYVEKVKKIKGNSLVIEDILVGLSSSGSEVNASSFFKSLPGVNGNIIIRRSGNTYRIDVGNIQGDVISKSELINRLRGFELKDNIKVMYEGEGLLDVSIDEVNTILNAEMEASKRQRQQRKAQQQAQQKPAASTANSSSSKVSEWGGS
jgi:hypothetical protein